MSATAKTLLVALICAVLSVVWLAVYVRLLSLVALVPLLLALHWWHQRQEQRLRFLRQLR